MELFKMHYSSNAAIPQIVTKTREHRSSLIIEVYVECKFIPV